MVFDYHVFYFLSQLEIKIFSENPLISIRFPIYIKTIQYISNIHKTIFYNFKNSYYLFFLISILIFYFSDLCAFQTLYVCVSVYIIFFFLQLTQVRLNNLSCSLIKTLNFIVAFFLLTFKLIFFFFFYFLGSHTYFHYFLLNYTSIL